MTRESLIRVSCMLQWVKKAWLLREAHSRHTDDVCLCRALDTCGLCKIDTPGLTISCRQSLHWEQRLPPHIPHEILSVDVWQCCSACLRQDLCHRSARCSSSILIYRAGWSEVCQEAFFRTKLHFLSVACCK